jgi:hypothetical protein
MIFLLAASLIAAPPFDSTPLAISKTPAALTEKKSVAKDPTLQENLKNGSYIRLSDGSLWNIRPNDVPVTQGWITPVEIKVSLSDDHQYPVKLTNTVTGSSVHARKASSVPADAPAKKAPAAPATPPVKKQN